MSWIMHSMIVPGGLRDLGNRIAAVFDPDTGGAETFSVPCSQDGQEPATHYATSVPIQSEHVSLLANPEMFYAAMVYLGQQRGREVDFSKNDVDELFSQLVVSLQEFNELLVVNDLVRILPVPP